ncbi:hypothetical protein A2U01_0051902, partial [Trifolium medium]|nr:hypothetical protein [Trifolium medium]
MCHNQDQVTVSAGFSMKASGLTNGSRPER